MESGELSRVCRLILSIVASWLAQQDELTRAIHRVTIEVIQSIGEAPQDLVVGDLQEEYPEPCPYHCASAVVARTITFLNSEFTELSHLFTGLFQEFNIRYFNGSLPEYHVKVMHDIPLPASPYTDSTVCENEIGPHELAIQYNGWPERMITRLIHLMAHIRTYRSHGTLWQSEMARLRGIGAPTDEDIERLEHAGWTRISAPPWRPS